MEQRGPLDTKAASAMVVLSAIWGLQQTAVKAVADAMPPILQIGVRSAVAAILVGMLVVIGGEIRGMGSGSWKPGLWVGLLFGLEFLFVAEGLRFTSASHMSIFLYTAPIFAALGLNLRLPAERLTTMQWIGVGIAFAGIVISFAGRGTARANPLGWMGDLLGLAAGASYGATTVSIRLSRLSNAPATVTLFYQLAGAAVLLLTAAALTDQTSFRPNRALALSLVFQIVIVSVLSFLAWFTLLRTYLASRLGVLSFMTPLFGIAFGVLGLGEELERSFIAGAVFVLAGILFVAAGDLSRQRTPRRRNPEMAVPESRTGENPRRAA